MIKAIVSGACGRMGSSIIGTIVNDEEIKLVGALERKGHPNFGKDAGEVNGLGRLGVLISDDLEHIIDEGEVLIEFTDPDTTLNHLRIAIEHNKAMVIGTTGFGDEQLKEIKEIAAQIPCVMAPNMSVGVNLLFKLAKDIAPVLGNDYDIEIVEAHHRKKKDAPSGTAIKIAEILAKALGRSLKEIGVYGRKGTTGERTKKEIGIHAVRAGDIVGEHTITFAGTGERLEITHRAHSRDTFAQGAMRAVKFVIKAKKGLYDMQDVLKLK
ncbi:MAG TPA: 4-hydroxy-tetrahydrodipicolinate reductase [bacterium]|nr:4-hydroxy-tetrahydrodipicolinate reductase [bacterium]